MIELVYHGCGHHWINRTDEDEIGRPVFVQGWCHVTHWKPKKLSTSEALAMRSRRCIEGLAEWARRNG
jgi:hypothetical protein